MPDLLINIVLDRSGSMESVRDSTIAGYNELLRSQKAQDGATYVSLTLFHTETELRHLLVPLEEVPLLDRASYRPDGWTALYDAVGDAITALEEAQARGAELPAKILFVVQTDGYENSSVRWSQKQLFDLVKKKQDTAGWAFLFLGCAIDAYGTGAQLGVPVANTISYNAPQTVGTFSVASNTARAYRMGEVTYDNLLVPDHPAATDPDQA